MPTKPIPQPELVACNECALLVPINPQTKRNGEQLCAFCYEPDDQVPYEYEDAQTDDPGVLADEFFIV